MDLRVTTEVEFFKLLSVDVKFFARKYMKEYHPEIVAQMLIKFREVIEKQTKKEE